MTFYAAYYKKRILRIKIWDYKCIIIEILSWDPMQSLSKTGFKINNINISERKKMFVIHLPRQLLY